MSNYQVDICHIQTSHLKTLSTIETKNLLNEYQQTKKEEVKAELVMGNLKLVLSLVSKFKQDELDDLFQAGCVGLIKAIEQFDLKQNVLFSTYAVPLIIGEIKSCIRNNSVFHISRYMRELSMKVARLKENHRYLYQTEIPKKDLMEALKITAYDLSQIENMHLYPSSLSEPKSGQEYLTLADVIEDKHQTYECLNNQICLKKALASLNQKERWFIEERYYKQKTQAQIAKELVLSQAQVSRMEKRILNQLKNYFI